MLGELAGDLFQLRRQAKVQRERDALVLQMQAGVLAAGFDQLALDALQLPGIQRQVAQLAFGIPALGAMHTGGGQLQRRQQRIELCQGRRRSRRRESRRHAVVPGPQGWAVE